MAKRKTISKTPIIISLTQEEKAKWFDILIKWFKEVRAKESIYAQRICQDEGALENLIVEKIRDACKGWKNNPIRLETRLKKVIGYDAKNPEVYKPLKWELKDDTQIAALKEKETISKKVRDIAEKESHLKILQKLEGERLDADIFKALELEIFSSFDLTDKEKVSIRTRLVNYLQSYKFNSANDRMALKTLLLEEVCLDRMMCDRLKPGFSFEKNLGSMIDNSIKNISKLQDDLGITAKIRKQNEDETIDLQYLFKLYKKKLEEFPDDRRIRFCKQAVIIYRKIKAGFLSENCVASYFPGHTFETLEKEIFWAIENKHIKKEDAERPKLSSFGLNFEDTK